MNFNQVCTLPMLSANPRVKRNYPVKPFLDGAWHKKFLVFKLSFVAFNSSFRLSWYDQSNCTGKVLLHSFYLHVYLSNLSGPLACPFDWYLNGSSCYTYKTKNETWNDARQSCSLLGGDLVKIDEDNEMSFLVQYMDTTNLKELAKVSKNQ